MILCWCSEAGPNGCYEIWHQSSVTQLEDKGLFLWKGWNKLYWPSTASFPSTVCWNTHWLKWQFRSPDVKPINAASVHASYWIQLPCCKESLPTSTADYISTSQIPRHRTWLKTVLVLRNWNSSVRLLKDFLGLHCISALAWWFFWLNLSSLCRLNCGFSATIWMAGLNFKLTSPCPTAKCLNGFILCLSTLKLCWAISSIFNEYQLTFFIF